MEYPDLAFLAGMNDLESLVFFMQPKTIEDISPLKGKAKLKRLHLYSAPVTDISVLAELAELEDLSLYMIKADDLSPIGGLTKLKRLSLYAIPATDMSPVENLTELRYTGSMPRVRGLFSPDAAKLRLHGLSKLDTLEYVEFMPKLKMVRMLREDIIDVSPLAARTSPRSSSESSQVRGPCRLRGPQEADRPGRGGLQGAQLGGYHGAAPAGKAGPPEDRGRG
ncbi:hypothetical protein MASR2M17_07370 [Aminivibrio sp.]